MEGGVAVSNQFEFTPDQNLWPHLRQKGSFLWWSWKGYQLPYSDVGADRPIDTSTISQLGAEPAFGPHQHGVELALPKDQSKWKKGWVNASGQPLQLGDPRRLIEVQVMRRTWAGDRPVYRSGDYAYTVKVPAPRAGYLWVQGNPQPVEHLSGWHDQHARILNPDGSSTEMIGATPKNSGGRTVSVEVRGLGRYDADGRLWDPRDRHVTVWKEETEQDGPAGRITPMMLGRAEAPHRLAISVPGVDAPDTLHEIGMWVGLPRTAVPWDDLTPDAHRVATMLVNHGAMTMDHGNRGNVIEITGADWAGVDWGNWKPTYDQFRRVAA